MSHMPGLEHYKIIKTLGTGSFGKVERNPHSVALHSFTKAKVAIKFILKNSPQAESAELKVKREIKILKRFKHPNIIRLYEVIESEMYTILVMEYVSEGEFYNLLERKGRFPEEEAKEYFRQILSAVDYCHSYKIAHRDIKPENLLVDKGNVLKLCDFGLSNFTRDGEFLKTSCGSPNYAAPEIISGEKYCGTEADIWSMGVVLYAIIAGTLPFDESNIPLLFSKIKSGKFRIPHTFSPTLSDLIGRMLVPDPIGRITISQIKNHPWMFSSAGTQATFLRPGFELSLKTIEKCLSLEAFQHLDKEQVIKFIRHGIRNDFTVTYNILLDLNKKTEDNNCKSVPGLLRKRTRSQSVLTKQIYKTPNNWVYGLRWHSKAIKLMERLFVVLKEIGLEWRIIDNFFLRVRPVEDKEYTRFDIKVYKFEESYVIDISNKYGKTLAIDEYIAGIYQALNICYPFNNN